jgi:hypothetical protein
MPTSAINAVKYFVLRTTYLTIIDVKIRKAGIHSVEYSTVEDSKLEFLDQ